MNFDKRPHPEKMTKFFNKFKKSFFFFFFGGHFPHFWSKNCFSKNPALTRIFSYGFLTQCQIYKKLEIQLQQTFGLTVEWTKGLTGPIL